MTAFSVPDWLLQVAATLAAFTAIIVFFITVAKTRFFKWIKKAVRKLIDKAKAELVELIEATMIPHVVRVELRLDQFEEKNDLQHAENKAAIEGLGEAIVEHRLETRDQLFEIRGQAKANHAILEAHFGEARVRDARLTALESGTSVTVPNVDLTITATPAGGEVPAVEKD